MARTAASADSRTYLPDDAHEAEILDFISALERSGGRAPEQRPALVATDGTRHEIPESMVSVLRQVAEALSAGMGVNVAPMNSMLTTQEASDYLGISRPTLVRILERGEIAMEKPGRHRYVRLSDLIAYKGRIRTQRREALDEMVRAGVDSGLYEAADGLPPRDALIHDIPGLLRHLRAVSAHAGRPDSACRRDRRVHPLTGRRTS